MAKTPLSSIAQFAPCTIFIRGKVAFSRLASRIEGAELEEKNQVAKSKGWITHQKPYIHITISNPTIVGNTAPEQVANVIRERFFTRQDGTVGYTIESKSPFWPTYLYSSEVEDHKNECVVPEGTTIPRELAVGLDVTIGAQLFMGKGSFNPGLGIKYIILNEPVRYFTSSNSSSDLEALGMNYAPNPDAIHQDPTPNYQATTPQAAPIPYNASPQPFVPPTQQNYNVPYTPYTAPQFTQPQYTQPQYPSFDPSDIPFNNAPTSMNFGAEQQIQRPVRNS